MDWQRLKTFYWVAKAGSFRQASDDRNLSAAALSRQIALLEQDLKVKLFVRHARGLRLTEMGESLFEAARKVYAETKRAESLLDSARGMPQGELRVTTATSFGTGWLPSRLVEFASRYPDIRIELLISTADLDIAMREADVAIRFVSVERPELVQKRLAKIRFHAWAAPSYLETFGIPERAEDLDGHRLIAFLRPVSVDYRAYNWPLWAGHGGKGERTPALKIDNINGAFQAVRSGFGIAVLPEYYAWDHPDLVQILPGLGVYERELNFLYPPELRPLQRLAVFRDFLVEKLQK